MQKYTNTLDVDQQYVEYNAQYDAYYDRRDGKWLETCCSDPMCDFCKDRPLVAEIPV